MSKRTYIYEDVEITRIVDGDTFKAKIDFGFSIAGNFTFRIHDVDTPETYRPSCEAELKHGMAATNFLKNLVKDKLVKLESLKLAIYGRYECNLWVDGKNVAQLLKDNGYEKLDSYPSDEVSF